MYYRFGKVFHFITVLLFIFAFLYIYSSLPEIVTLETDANGVSSKMMSKSAFFYSGILVFLILNVLLVTPGKLIENQSTANIKRLFPKGDIFRDYMLTWIYSFVGIINFSLGVLALFVHSINNQNEISTGDFALFFYLVPIFFVVWIIGLFWILIQKFKTLKKRP